MIDGVLRHDTEMEVEKTYVDSHGQSEVLRGHTIPFARFDKKRTETGGW
jgi:TnpA family transposase